jgi:hypothetical protein
MADPHPLYFVGAAVFTGLIAWVAGVLLRAERFSQTDPRDDAKREPPADRL